MAPVRCNLHAPTRFSDGGRSAADLVADPETLGYDFLAIITGHEDRIGEESWAALGRPGHPGQAWIEEEAGQAR